MTCCVPTAADELAATPGSTETDASALLTLSRRLGDGLLQLDYAVPDAHCASCIRTIEGALDALPHVTRARVNLRQRQVRVTYDPAVGSPAEFAPAILSAGYHTYLADRADAEGGDGVLRELIRSMAVAGFAAGNIMLFSVSVWAGADAATRDLFHWISAFIALPAIVYSGQPFFRSAWRALRVARTNMDVPISIGIVLATGLSLYETMRSGEHAYFDASTMLLFFLLAGRTLDHMMRERARSAIGNLARLAPRGAVVLAPDGTRDFLTLDQIEPGMVLELRAGDRVPVDGTVVSGEASIDTSVVNGESLPRQVKAGGALLAGMHNLDGLLLLHADARSADSFLSRMAEMMDAAAAARTRRRRLADRAAAVYAPIVHLTAFTTFVAWMTLTGDAHLSLTNAVAVLIITCPCALALAVPMVHVVAAGRLFGARVLMKDGAGLERIAEIEHVALDKTGTLTFGRPILVDSCVSDEGAWRMAACLAASSRHPLSIALAAALPTHDQVEGPVTELAGRGVSARVDGIEWRLGRPDWCGGVATGGDTQVWLSRDGLPVARFSFADAERPEAAAVLARLEDMGLGVTMLSGDAAGPVRRLADALGIADARGELAPDAKVAALARLGRVLMVGDGINDAAAMTAAHVSMAPASAADIGRSAADFVYMGNSLDAVPFTIDIARRAASLVRQNLGLAIGYNAIAVPLAVLGLVTPLIAAIAMSVSSLIVVGNALRLGSSASLRWQRASRSAKRAVLAGGAGGARP